MGRRLCLALVLVACGGTEPLPLAEPVDEVSLLIRDEGLSLQYCAARAELEVKAKLEISGVLGHCNVSVKEDGSALSLCDEVPAKKPRDVRLVYYHPQKQYELELLAVTISIDLTDETRERVELDFSDGERDRYDDDDDGMDNFDELCAGRDPRDAGS